MSAAENPDRWKYVTDNQLELEGVGPPPRCGDGQVPPQNPAAVDQRLGNHTTTRQFNAYVDEPEYVRKFYAHWVIMWPDAPQDTPAQVRRRHPSRMTG